MMGRRPANVAKRRGIPTIITAATVSLLLVAGLSVVLKGPSMFGVRPEWAANVAATIARNTTAVTAVRLRDGLAQQRASFADVRAAAADLRSGERTTLQADGGSGNAAAPPDHMVIVARLAEDISWLPMQLGDIPVVVYQFVPNLEQHRQYCPPGQEDDWPQQCPHYAAGHVGREASAYLQFIHDHYDNLPSSMLFLHGHEKGWHRGSAAGLIRKLKWGALPFANLRHWGYTDWDCHSETHQQRGEWPCASLGYCLTPREPAAANDPALNEPQGARFYAAGASQMLAERWAALFQAEFGELPEQVVPPACCAEFMVSRERVLQRPLSFYRNALDVFQAAQDVDSFALGVSFEVMWHMIFGEPAVMHAASKCDLLECSEEEAADPKFEAPPVVTPYMLHHLRTAAAGPSNDAATATSSADPATDGSPAAEAGRAAAESGNAAAAQAAGTAGAVHGTMQSQGSDAAAVDAGVDATPTQSAHPAAGGSGAADDAGQTPGESGDVAMAQAAGTAGTENQAARDGGSGAAAVAPAMNAAAIDGGAQPGVGGNAQQTATHDAAAAQPAAGPASDDRSAAHTAATVSDARPSAALALEAATVAAAGIGKQAAEGRAAAAEAQPVPVTELPTDSALTASEGGIQAAGPAEATMKGASTAAAADNHTSAGAPGDGDAVPAAAGLVDRPVSDADGSGQQPVASVLLTADAVPVSDVESETKSLFAAA